MRLDLLALHEKGVGGEHGVLAHRHALVDEGAGPVDRAELRAQGPEPRDGTFNQHEVGGACRRHVRRSGTTGRLSSADTGGNPSPAPARPQGLPLHHQRERVERSTDADFGVVQDDGA